MEVSPKELGLKPETWRDGQWEAIEEIVDAEQSVVVLDAPTGSGKTVLALGVAGILGRTFINTHTKSLQDQYMEEANGHAESIKGRANYPCILANDDGTMASILGITDYNGAVFADDAPCSIGYVCPSNSHCPYFVAKRRALASSTSIHNYSYWIPESTYLGGFSGGELIVCDEGHLLDDVMCEFQSVAITGWMIKELGLKTPDGIDWEGWRVYAKKAAFKCLKEADKCVKFSVQQVGWRKLWRTFNAFLAVEDTEGWLIDREGQYGVKIRPVWPSGFEDMFLGEKAKKALIMSATILDPELFTTTLGIKDYKYIKMPWTFPIDNRPVYYRPVAEVTKKNTGQAAEGLGKAIDAVLNERKGEKGIIHSHSFDLLEAVLPHIANQDRLIIHNRGNNRGELIDRHKRSKQDKWLISPSISHGEDFKYDMARSQIILKMPFPDLGNKVVQMRLKEKPKWFKHKTAQILTQMIGRVNRAADDYGETFVFDSKFETLMAYIPQEVQDAIK